MEGVKAFKLYGNLLSDEARQPWEMIVQAGMTKCLWDDIYGVKKELREFRRKSTCCLQVPSSCQVSPSKSQTGCRGCKACRCNGRSKGLQTLRNLFSLGKRSFRPKQLNVHGKMSTESLMMKLLPKPGTPSWSASQSTYSRCSDMTGAKPSNITLQTC